MIQISRTLVASALMMLVGQVSTLGAQSTGPIEGPVGPSPYNITVSYTHLTLPTNREV